MKRERMWQRCVPRLVLVFVICMGLSPAFGQTECYELVWSDEFSGAAVDATKWEFEVNGEGGGNQELQYYTDRPDNTQVVDGKLQIIAREEVFTGPDGTRNFTSSRLRTAGLAEWTYGRIEASIKIPEGQGMWPAFWMLPTDYAYGIWPQSGEIDIMENVGFEPDIVHGTIHYGQLFPNNRSTGTSTSVPNSATEFHTYAVEWEENEIRWYVDDVLYSTRVPSDIAPEFWPFDQDFHIILNVAVGGSWPGPPDNTTVFPQTMEVDYVRVYKGLNHYAIAGPTEVRQGDEDTYSIEPISGASYNWSVPAGATLVSGQGTNSVDVNWGALGSGDLSCEVVTGCDSETYVRSITIEEALTISHIFDDFEGNRNATYDLALTSGTLTQAVANPNAAGANTSAQVGQYVRNASEQFDVLFVSSDAIGNANAYVDGRKSLFMDLYTDAPVGTSITINIEDASLSNSNDFPVGRHSSYTATTSVQNEWQSLEFTYDSSPDAEGTGIFSVDQLAILFDPNANTGNTYYFDNFQVGSESDPPVLSTELIEDFDGTSNWNQSFVSGTFNAPVANPGTDATNGSANVASYMRNSSEQFDVIIYNGVSQIPDAGLMITGDSKLLMDVYTSAPIGTPLSFNLENSSVSSGDFPAGRHSIYQAVTTVQNEWETVSFEYAFQPDASTADGSIDQIVFLLNSNSFTGDTYYFDNVRVINTKPPTSYTEGDVFNDYETLEQFTYASSDGTFSGTIANPAPDATNGSANVVSYARNGGSLFDVLFFNTTAIASSGPYESEEKTFAVDIYTDATPGTPVTFQLEDGTVTSAENFPSGRRSRWIGTTTVQNAWETVILTYDGVLDAGTSQNAINQIAVLFDANNLSSNTYFIDNIRDLNVVEGGEPFLARFEITPAADTLEIGETVQFAAQGKDQFGADIAGTATWSTDGGGTIDAAGLFTATTSGLFTVTASEGSASGTAEIRVNGVAQLTSIAITPSATQIFSNETTTFSAQGLDQFGEVLATTVAWTSNGGSIDTNGVFTPDATGSFEITATSGSISETATVTVLDPPVLTSIAVSPGNVTLDLDQAQAFTAQGLDQYNQPIASTVIWTTSGGSITAEGDFSASVEGSYTITATDGPVSGTAEAIVEAPITAPPVAAPAPASAEADVISVYSDAYTSITGVNTNPFWGQSTVVTEEVIEGNNTLKYANFNYQGTDFSGNAQDVSGMEFVHLDMWTADATSVTFYLISPGPLEVGYTLPITPGIWQSYDIPLSEFSSVVDMTNVVQFKFDGGDGTPTLYLDNLYFYQSAPVGGPAVAAPTPTEDASDVVSLFSNAYTDVTVGTFSAVWDDSDVADEQVAGDDIKKYTFTNFAGIDFSSNKLNLSSKTRFHLDIWTPDDVADKSFTIKNVDFGGGNAEVSSHILTVTQAPNGSIPALTTGSWISIDVNISDFVGNTTRSDLAQIVITSNLTTVYIDNLYFYGDDGSGGGGDTPTVSAPAPTSDAADVISIYSDAYTDIAGVNTNPFWGQTTVVTDEMIGTDNVLKYASFNYQGTDFSGNPQDVSGMDFVHIDMWTANATTVDFYLISAGPQEVAYNLPITTGSWQSYDIPLSAFASGVDLTSVIQFKFDGGDGSPTLYLDNMYFYVAGELPTEPTAAAPTPTTDEAEVISVYSDAYTSIAGVNTNPFWGQSTVVTEEVIEGNNTLKYASFNYQGTDFSGNAQDVSGMGFVHLDMWTADATSVTFYLISPGPAEVGYTLPITPGSWQGYDIPLSEFSSVVDLTNVIQFKFDGGDGTPTLYLDNLYFFESGGSTGGGGPTVAAPTPTQDASDVVSLFSNAYTDVTVDAFSAVWDDSDVADEQVDGDDVKKYTFTNFAGIDFSNNKLNLASKTRFHMDMWTPDDIADKSFTIKNVDFGGGNAEASSHILTVTQAPNGSIPALATGSWVAIDVEISDFVGNTTRSDLAQIVISTNLNTVYIDNLYFYGDDGTGGGGDAPTAAAPSPTEAESNVISLFSDAYTDVPVDTWRTGWSAADLEDVVIDGSAMKKYSNLNFVGIETTSNQIDASGMSHFHFDLWTPDATQFRVKLVDFGADGAFGGTDDTEHELTYDSPGQGQWISYDIPLGDFTGLTTTSNIAQLIYSGAPAGAVTAFIDNVYFYNEVAVTCESGLTGNTPGEEYVLIWADEFDASGAVCDENWFHQTQIPTPGGWFNGEEQHYTDRLENSSVANGLLSVTAKRETYTDQGLTRNYTSARLNSKFAFTYGRVDVRAKLPAGSGTWPAIWMLGQNVNEPGGFWFDEFGTTNWPATGEIDIMEHFGNQNAVIHGSVHTPESFGATVNTGTTSVPDFNTAFHDYSIIWDEDQIQFMVDDVVYYTYNPSVKNSDTWPFDKPQYLLLNVAMGGFSGTIPSEWQEGTMEIDYVRVYQKEFVAPTEPLTAADAPTQQDQNVISLFSDAYTDVPVDTWRTGWSAADLEDVTIAGSAVKKYTNLNFVGVETVANQIDASNMTHFHFDLWTPDATQFRTKLVDFGADGAFGGGDDTEHELTFDAPQQGQWISYDIPLSDFTGLTTNSNIAQLIYAANPAGSATAFIDNVYFYRELTAPEMAAPTPPQDAADVISMFSNAYTDVPVDTWRTVWSSGDLEDIIIDGSDVKKYTNLSFVGVETVNNQIDASAMDFFHFDLWTPDAEQFRVKWVDFGADGAFGGTDDTEFELSYDNPAPGQWVAFDIPLSSFAGMNTSNLAQLIFSGNPAGEFTAYLDNVYFYSGSVVTPEPAVAAPNPTQDASNVISLFSEAYADVPVDTWRTEWSVGDLEDVTIDGSAMKKYTNLNFVGIETVSNQIDATGMTHFRFDLWSPDVTLFRVKLVDFGPDGVFGGGDDAEHELAFDSPGQSEWVSFDIPLTDFINLTSTGNVSQLIFSGQPAGLFTSFVDNVYFYNDEPAPAGPTVAAATPPARDAAQVISLFSNAYTDETVDTFSAVWDDSDVADVQVAGDDVKRYTFTNFAGIDFSSNKLDVSVMDKFHMDIWTSDDVADKAFTVKAVDFGGGNAEASNFILTVTQTANGDIPALASGSWVSMDVDVAAFVGNLTRSDLAQMVITTNLNTVYVDNIYFYTDTDLAAPSVPANLAAANVTDSGFDVSWSRSKDNVGVAGYNVYLDGALTGTTTDTTFSIGGLTAVTTYEVQVEAFDAAGNSTSSDVLSVTTASPPCSETLVNLADFEQNDGVWRWNRRSANLVRSKRLANSGKVSVKVKRRIRTRNLDLSSFEDLSISFNFYAVGMKDNGGLILEMSTSGGDTWEEVGRWTVDADFVNRTRAFVSVDLTGPFTAETRFRLKKRPVRRGGNVFVDDIAISGCSTGGFTTVAREAMNRIEEVETFDMSQLEEVSIYPNPVRETLNLKGIQADSQIELLNLSGQVILQATGVNQLDVKDVPVGLYLLRVIQENDVITLRVNKQ